MLELKEASSVEQKLLLLCGEISVKMQQPLPLGGNQKPSPLGGDQKPSPLGGDQNRLRIIIMSTANEKSCHRNQ